MIAYRCESFRRGGYFLHFLLQPFGLLSPGFLDSWPYRSGITQNLKRPALHHTFSLSLQSTQHQT